MARLRELYLSSVAPEMVEEFKYKNKMQAPKLEKIVLNMCLGSDAIQDSKKIAIVMDDLALIAGQKPVVTKAKKSIAGFKLREGMNIGLKVTLRGARMWEFLDRLINIAMPRIRDFRGLSNKSFDGKGNYAFGIKEHIIFPEINYDKVDKVRGFDVIICTTANTNKEAESLLRKFNFPFMT